MASTAWFASRRCRTSTDPRLPATPSLGSARPWDGRLHEYGRNRAGNGRNSVSFWRCPMPDSPTVSPIVADRRPLARRLHAGGRQGPANSQPRRSYSMARIPGQGNPLDQRQPRCGGSLAGAERGAADAASRTVPAGALPRARTAVIRPAAPHLLQALDGSAQETARAICSTAEQWPVERPPGMARCNAMTRSRPAAGTTGLAAASGIMAPALRFPDEP